MCRVSWKSGSLNLLEPSGPHRASYGTALHREHTNNIRSSVRYLWDKKLQSSPITKYGYIFDTINSVPYAYNQSHSQKETYTVVLFHIPTLMHNSFIHQQYVYYTTILDIFRALTCPSSGGRMRADCSPLSSGILYNRLHRLTIPDDVTIKFVLLKMDMLMLETCRGL